MTWTPAAVRAFTFVALAALTGWYYGNVFAGMVVGLLLVLAFSVYQFRLVETWLRHPDRPPPDAYGIWGDLLAQISAGQRENRQIQQQLQASVRYLQDSLSSMRDGVVMVDQHGSIKWLNRAVEPLLGLRYPQDTGQALTNLVRDPQLRAYFAAADFSTPLQYRRGGKETNHLRIEVTHFGEGEVLLFIRDVSAAVRIEEIHREFVANVSHELRTPLTVISGYLGMLHDNSEALPERFVKPVEQMRQQAERMEGLLKDLLWLSRLEHKERKPALESIDMAALLEEVRDSFSLQFADTPIELDITSSRRVRGDYRDLYSAVSNLVVNAIKYSRPASPVKVSWREGEHCDVLAVTDRGCGIDEIHLPRLTERFYRVDDSRNTATGGTGLGLAIVKHVAAAHGAKLEIDSKLGSGSTFSLIFPVGD